MNDCHFGVSPVNYPDPDPDLILQDIVIGNTDTEFKINSCLLN